MCEVEENKKWLVPLFETLIISQRVMECNMEKVDVEKDRVKLKR